MIWVSEMMSITVRLYKIEYVVGCAEMQTFVVCVLRDVHSLWCYARRKQKLNTGLTPDIQCRIRLTSRELKVRNYYYTATTATTSDVSPWPWPWHLKSLASALALTPQVLGLDTSSPQVLGLDTSSHWPWPWPWHLKSLALALIPQVLGLDISSPWPWPWHLKS